MPIQRDGLVTTHMRLNDGTSSDNLSVTTAPTTLWSIAAFNRSSANPYFLHFFDNSSAVSTVASSAPDAVISVLVPVGAVVPSTAANAQVAAGAGVVWQPPMGIRDFNSGIAYRISTGAASSVFSTLATQTAFVNLVYTPTT